ncbi:MAG: DUF4203 domain-containing protein [candidate division WOR-3 bacterium]
MTINWLPRIIALALGLVITFFGYRLLKFTLIVAGFVLGAYLGGFIALKAGAANWLVIVAVIVLGIIAALLAVFLFKASIFLLGAAAGALLTAILSSGSGWNHLLFLLIGAVVGGILALLIKRPVIALLTAFVGSWFTVAAIFSFLGKVRIRLGEGVHMPVMVILWLALGAIGFIVQLSQTGKKKKK